MAGQGTLMQESARESAAQLAKLQQKQAAGTLTPGEREQLEYMLKEQALSAEGAMYEGKNNNAAMREAEAARGALGEVKRQTRLDRDFPVGGQGYSKVLEFWRRDTGAAKDAVPDNATLNAYWQKIKGDFSLEPSAVPAVKKKPRNIPEAVEYLGSKGE